MPTIRARPYPIAVTFRVSTDGGANYTNTQGCRVWIKDIGASGKGYGGDQVKDRYTVGITDSKGKIMLNLQAINNAYANAGTVRIFYKYGDIEGYVDHTISTKAGQHKETISVIKAANLTDGLSSTEAFDQIRKERGCQPGLKDELT